MRILVLSATLFETFLILRRIKRDGSINVLYLGIYVKYP